MRRLLRDQTAQPHNKIVGKSDREKNQTKDSDKRTNLV